MGVMEYYRNGSNCAYEISDAIVRSWRSLGSVVVSELIKHSQSQKVEMPALAAAFLP